MLVTTSYSMVNMLEKYGAQKDWTDIINQELEAGYSIYFPEGEYTLNNPIQVPPRKLRIAGAGMWKTIFHCPKGFINYEVDVNNYGGISDKAFSTKTFDFNHFSDFSILQHPNWKYDPKNLVGYAIRYKGAGFHYNNFDNIRIKGYSHGMLIESQGWLNKFSNCRFMNADKDCIQWRNYSYPDSSGNNLETLGTYNSNTFINCVIGGAYAAVGFHGYRIQGDNFSFIGGDFELPGMGIYMQESYSYTISLQGVDADNASWQFDLQPNKANANVLFDGCDLNRWATATKPVIVKSNNVKLSFIGTDFNMKNVNHHLNTLQNVTIVNCSYKSGHLKVQSPLNSYAEGISLITDSILSKSVQTNEITATNQVKTGNIITDEITVSNQVNTGNIITDEITVSNQVKTGNIITDEITVSNQVKTGNIITDDITVSNQVNTGNIITDDITVSNQVKTGNIITDDITVSNGVIANKISTPEGFSLGSKIPTGSINLTASSSLDMIKFNCPQTYSYYSAIFKVYLTTHSGCIESTFQVQFSGNTVQSINGLDKKTFGSNFDTKVGFKIVPLGNQNFMLKVQNVSSSNIGWCQWSAQSIIPANAVFYK